MGAASSSTATVDIPRPALATTAPAIPARNLGYNDDIAALQLYILFEILAGTHLPISEVKHLLPARSATNDDDAVELSIGIRPARHAQGLEHVNRRVHRNCAGLVHLSNDVGHVARGGRDSHQDHGVGN